MTVYSYDALAVTYRAGALLYFGTGRTLLRADLAAGISLMTVDENGRYRRACTRPEDEDVLLDEGNEAASPYGEDYTDEDPHDFETGDGNEPTRNSRRL